MALSVGFSPDDILLRPGESAIFEITSRDLGHTFTIDDLMLDSEVPEGQTISVSRPRRRGRTPSIVRSPGTASRAWRVLSRYERPAPPPLGAPLEAAATDRHTDLQNSSQSKGSPIDGGRVMRLSLRSLAITAAILWGGAVFITGAANAMWPTYGVAFLQLAESIYPGYHATGTFGSVIVGTLYSITDGAVAGLLFGWIYNRFVEDGGTDQDAVPEGEGETALGTTAS